MLIFLKKVKIKSKKVKNNNKDIESNRAKQFQIGQTKKKSFQQMSNQRIKIELSPEYFRARFKVLTQMHDPFSRSYFIASDSVTQKRAIYKHYLAETQQQLQAIYDNIENYIKLSQQQGICRILAYTRLVAEQQVLAAFQYSDLSLGQYIMTQEFSSNRPMFYISLLQQLTTIIKSMSEIGIDLDQLNYGNILVCYRGLNQLQIKVLYDQREKAYQKVLEGVKTFTSLEKLVALIGGDEGYFSEMGEDGPVGESIYQLGLLLIDMMHKCENNLTTTTTREDNCLVRDNPVNRSLLLNTQKSYYLFDDNTITRNHDYINDKLTSLRNNPLRVIKQLTQLSELMMERFEKRIKIYQIHGQVERIIKVYKDSSVLVKKNSKVEGGGKNIEIGGKRNEISQVENLALGNKQYHQQLVSSYSLPQSVSYTKLMDSNSRENYTTLTNTKESLSQVPSFPTTNAQNRPSSLTLNYCTQNNQPYKRNQLNHLQNNVSNQKPSSKLIIPKESILTNLKAHQSIRLSLENLIREIQNGHEVRKKQYYDSSVYYGSVSQLTNKRNGLGVYLYPTGDVYFGTWLENQLVDGTYVFKNGESYEGSVRNGKQGWGRYRYANGNIYEGEWRDDVKDGKGTMWYPNNDRYEGQWVKGKKNGLGKYFYNNGTSYEGNFVNGRKQGLGTITFSNGTKIQANWQQTHIQGEGKVSYSNGDYFQGEYCMSQKHGKGMYIWGADNTKYEGEFAKDALEGQARIYFTFKQYYSGRIRNGKRDGQGNYVYENGDSFTGEWKNDMKLIGTYKFNNGEQFEGKFKDNQLHFGVLRYFNGESYEGEFKNGCRHGIGSYRDRFGALICEGHWQNDNFLQYDQYQWHA